jgi:putative membrane protein
MKSLLRNVGFNAFSLFVLTQTLDGVKIYGGLPTYIVGGLVLYLLFLILKPILGIITLPLNLITLGLFSFIINIIIFYILTVFVSSISINAFLFKGLSIYGFIIPKIYLNQFFALMAAALIQALIVNFLIWLTKK